MAILVGILGASFCLYKPIKKTVQSCVKLSTEKLLKYMARTFIQSGVTFFQINLDSNSKKYNVRNKSGLTTTSAVLSLVEGLVYINPRWPP